MATFPENLATIQNAVLGEDMRQAIHDAIEQSYEHGSEITVDSELSDVSENPVQNKVIKGTIDNKVDKVAGKGLSTNDFTTEEKNKLAGINENIDSSLSNTSENPVQNKVITLALDEKATYEEMTMVEYNALSESQKTDGTMRFIIDSDGDAVITKNGLGLDNVDNTSDINKPVSIAQRQAIDAVTTKSVVVTGTDVTINAVSNTRYICGELSALDFVPSATGISDVIFTSGSSKTILTLPNTVKMPNWFEVEVNMIYEISIADGIYGVVASWEI